MADLVKTLVHQSAKRELFTKVLNERWQGLSRGGFSEEPVPTTLYLPAVKWQSGVCLSRREGTWNRSWGCKSLPAPGRSPLEQLSAAWLACSCWSVLWLGGEQNPPRAPENRCSNMNLPIRLPVLFCTFLSLGIPLTISWLYNRLRNYFLRRFSSNFDLVPPFSMCFGQCFMHLLFGVQNSLWNYKAQFGLWSITCGYQMADPSGLSCIS